MLAIAPRVILKYRNRRLYDTATHRYIKLKDLRELVTREVSFVIRDKVSGADLTRAALLNLLIDGETSSCEMVLCLDFLLKTIRAQTSLPRGDLQHQIYPFGSGALAKRA